MQHTGVFASASFLFAFIFPPLAISLCKGLFLSKQILINLKSLKGLQVNNHLTLPTILCLSQYLRGSFPTEMTKRVTTPFINQSTKIQLRVAKRYILGFSCIATVSL